jgi:hypothetical protein
MAKVQAPTTQEMKMLLGQQSVDLQKLMELDGEKLKIIHVTDRRTFKECRQKYSYAVQQRLAEKGVTSDALWFGTGLHHGLAEYYRVGANPAREWRALAMRERRSPENPTGVEVADDIIQLGVDMLNGYVQFWEEIDKDWEIIAVEQPLFYRMGPVLLRGTVDLLVRWRGGLWIVDHKCCDQNSLVDLADGSAVRIGDLIGQTVELTSFNWKTLQQETTKALIEDNGVEDVYEIQLESGKLIQRTGNHPLIVPEVVCGNSHSYKRGRRWKQAGDVQKGDYILTPSILCRQGAQTMSDDELKILALLIGDGGLTHYTTSGVRFTNSSSVLVEEFTAIAEEMGDTVVLADQRSINYRVAGRGVYELILQHGLDGSSSHTKFVPVEVFRQTDEGIATFLRYLFATDGCAVYKSDKCLFDYSTVSEELCRGVQRLLLRLGIYSVVAKDKSSYKKPDGTMFHGHVWKCRISRAQEALKFAERVGILGKEEAVGKVRQAALLKMQPRTRGGARKETDVELQGYRWERVVEARCLGPRPTASVTILTSDPDLHTFITAEACEHNTAAKAPNVKHLEMDDQMTAYIWLARELGLGTIRGCIYNVLIKKAPSKPRIIYGGTAVSRSLASTMTYESYMDAIIECGADPDDYKTELETLRGKGSAFFERHEIARNPKELDRFGEDLQYELLDMVSEQTRMYPSPGANCTWCQYQVLCKAEREGSDSTRIRETLYRIRTEEER